MSTLPLLVAPNPVVASLQPYSSGRAAEHIELNLDANEGQPIVTRQNASAPLQSYPSTRRLEGLIARRLGIDEAAVLVTAGADDALERALRAVCAPGREVVLTTPTFEMLGRYARLAGAAVAEVEWWSGAFPVQEVLDLGTERAAAVGVVSPNNPTGAVISQAAVEALIEGLPRALVLLDHAYVEFARDDLTHVALRHPNALVFRTFSKAWGCAGLRVGYVVGDPRVIRWLRAVGHPYPVGSPSLGVVEGLLESGGGPPEHALDEVRRQREALTGLLCSLGCEPLPSEGNFVLARCPEALQVRARLASIGVAVRGFAGHALLEPYLRITVPGTGGGYDRLESALRTALAPEALVFDMDGVLADVSASYREAVLATAGGFGVTLTARDVAQAKAEGNANNDWELTRRLLAEHGVDRSLDEVRSRFECLYQGCDGRPGLRERERALLERGQLRELAARRPLAVVSGRPRRDAERFLVEHGLDDCFEALVCMEDAPAKPDPRPVRLALEQLGACYAWMLGDTPDDVRAARAAGVVPLGVVAPGDDAEVSVQSLYAAGAAQVLLNTAEILEVIP